MLEIIRGTNPLRSPDTLQGGGRVPRTRIIAATVVNRYTYLHWVIKLVLFELRWRVRIE